jgi:hypothetical protein
MIDIAGAQGGGEGDSIGAGEPDQRVVAAFAVEDVGAPAGSLIPCESSGPDRFRRLGSCFRKSTIG